MSKAKKKEGYLAGKLIVAMPQMQDPRFAHAVIYMCGHDENGAMGLVLNRLVESLTFEDLLAQLELEIGKVKASTQVHFGGPVEMGRGFVLHTDDYKHEASVLIADNIMLTATTEILQDIALGKGPKKSLLALGYAGWGAGQIEIELQNNGWLEVEADQDLIFSCDLEGCWERAIRKLGIDPAMLSFESGHA